MGGLILKDIPWQTFDQDWIDLDYFRHIILDTYERLAKKGIPEFEDIRTDQLISEEITMPIISYYTFGCEEEWHGISPGKTADRFFDNYEDRYCEVENDILAMMDMDRLFFNHYEENYGNIPVSVVW